VRRILPWAISLAALVYVFGFATDWPKLVEATRNANLPLFLAITIVDKVVFFVMWSLLQAESLRRFVAPVPWRSMLALRGGSELVRAVNHGFGDAAFALGLMRLVPGRSIAVVLAALFVPFLCHMMVLLAQVTLCLPLLEGGLAANRDVVIAATIGWLTVLVGWALVRFGPRLGLFGGRSLAERVAKLDLRRMRPILGWFVVLGILDIVFQRTTAAAFGATIPWTAMTARIPILYAAISLPSLGNLGTRELAWAWCFEEFAPRDVLVAYALATNATFIVLNVAIGALFLPRALELLAQVRREKEAGAPVQPPLLSDPADP
jgi:hypothetical protein